MNTLLELSNLYPRLVAALPAESTGQSNDNAAGYAASTDPRRAPLRVEVSDLLAEIEETAKTICSHVCSVLDAPACLIEPGRRRGVDAETMAAFHTLGHYWPRLELAVPAMAAAAEDRLYRLVLRGQRLVGEAPPPPAALETRCPSCGLPSIFRVETPHGEVLAVCSNPEDAVEGGRRQWSETEWEDAHAPATA